MCGYSTYFVPPVIVENQTAFIPVVCRLNPLILPATSKHTKHQHDITMSSTTTQKQMFEGLGAPVNVAQTEGQHIDPTLDSCCQREVYHTANMCARIFSLF